MSNPLKPRHEVEIGGVKYPLRYELLDWAEAQRILGEPLLPWGATPFWERAIDSAAKAAAGDSQAVDAEAIRCNYVLLFTGLRRAIPGLTMDRLADLVSIEDGNEVFSAVGSAMADFWDRVRAVAEKRAAAANPTPTPSGGSTELGPSADVTSESGSASSGA